MEDRADSRPLLHFMVPMRARFRDRRLMGFWVQTKSPWATSLQSSYPMQSVARLCQSASTFPKHEANVEWGRYKTQWRRAARTPK